jgi:hypothetical protein
VTSGGRKVACGLGRASRQAAESYTPVDRTGSPMAF